jgi:hypothetical protein
MFCSWFDYIILSQSKIENIANRKYGLICGLAVPLSFFQREGCPKDGVSFSHKLQKHPVTEVLLPFILDKDN